MIESCYERFVKCMVFPVHEPSIALQLAQVGALSASRWSERLRPLGITPGEGVVLRVISASEHASQRELADSLGVAPSRVVALVDALEARHLVARTRSPEDRRRYRLALTDDGREVLAGLFAAGAAHEADIAGSLSSDERRQLSSLLSGLVDGLGLRPGIHPEVGR